MKKGDLVKMNAIRGVPLRYGNAYGIVVDVDNISKAIKVLFSNPNISRLQADVWRTQEDFKVISEAK